MKFLIQLYDDNDVPVAQWDCGIEGMKWRSDAPIALPHNKSLLHAFDFLTDYQK